MLQDEVRHSFTRLRISAIASFSGFADSLDGFRKRSARVSPCHFSGLIVKQDGQTKNDCERNATKRLLKRVRALHPKLKIIVVEDGLASNAPHIADLKAGTTSLLPPVSSRAAKTENTSQTLGSFA